MDPRHLAACFAIVVLLLGEDAWAQSIFQSPQTQPSQTRISLAIRTGSGMSLQKRLDVKFGLVLPMHADARHPLAENPTPRSKGLAVKVETRVIPLYSKETGFVYGVQMTDKEAHLYETKREEGNLKAARTYFDGMAARTGQRKLPDDVRQWTPEERNKVEKFLTSGYFNWRTDARPVDGIMLRYDVTRISDKKMIFSANVPLNTSGSLMMYNFDPGDEPGERVLEVFADNTLIKSIRFNVVPPKQGDRTPLPFAHCAALSKDKKGLAACRPKL